MSEGRPGALAALSLLGAIVSVLGFVSLAGDERLPPAPTTTPIAAPTPQPTKKTSAKQRVDGRTGLVLDAGWELVATHCTGCHSPRLVTQNAGDRAHWERMLRWMQSTQNLALLPPDVEATVLDYLAKNYGPRAFARRAPLDPWLLPPDPNRTRQAGAPGRSR